MEKEELKKTLSTFSPQELAEILGLDLIKEIFRNTFPQELGEILGRSLLSDRAIKKHLELGNIVIDPFDERNLGTCNYDLALGPWFYRAQIHPGSLNVYNFYSESEVKKVWGEEPQYAEPASKYQGDRFYQLEGIASEDLIIWIKPGETILCHTQEFIGGRGGIVTTMMKARSSIGKNFIEVCKCAGWGDVGFTNRWTMEVTNNSFHYLIPLVVGRRVAQMVFFEVEKIEGSEYTQEGKYQSITDIEGLKRSWNPKMILPKMYKDWEVKIPI